MDIIDTLNISGAGLSAQRIRLQVVASNMANARSVNRSARSVRIVFFIT